MLFLFDIDGTLLRRLPPAHCLAICSACRTVFGIELEAHDLGHTAGMTDSAIARRALAAHQVPAAEVEAGLPVFFTAAADAYDELVDADLTAYHTPYAAQALAWLTEHGAALGLVTGNIERIAWRKLGAAQLSAPFRCGAFGDEAESRDDLPPLALERARAQFGREFQAQAVYVVGDTPFDIACGVASGLRTIAVATGSEHTAEHLRACHPDYLIDDLRALEHLALS
ncbi:MAG TPA: HAD family hydrolase [Ktedonobacterales bacterium]|nr:HAD family hydrolase [Ktedonobacterales bacterium]